MPTNLARDLGALVKGRVLDDAAARAETSGDFGRMIVRHPGVVVRPDSTDDVAAVIRYARRVSIPIATRGQAHSQSGQSLTDGGILLDLNALDRILAVDSAALQADCQAGVRWETLVQRTIPAGVIPPVLTNNLGVTVGGTLSVAGLGVASFRHGTQGDNVTEIEAVTGAGDVVICSPTLERELFDAVRSGMGQFGVITRARLGLRRCLPRARTYYLLYDDLQALMRDAGTLIDEDRVDDLEAWCTPCPQGFRWTGGAKEAFASWFFPLQATVEFEPTSPPDDRTRLKGLSPYRRVHIEDQDLIDFARRLEPLFGLWKRSGYWGAAHPWMEVVLPWQTAGPFITQVLAGLPPTALGGGHILLWPSRGTSSSVPLFMTPSSPLVMGFGVLPGIPPDLLPQARQRLNMLSDLSVQAGGKRYLSGFIEFDGPRWRRHFGPAWDRVRLLKTTYDPDGILNPGFIDFRA
ncbi:MAG TPA: FAD-binding protein [Candidatus Polarisedimenticolia bacterium]|nr:FAD-binding protein [Candidatus Polarisedimenticolia bacterium]